MFQKAGFQTKFRPGRFSQKFLCPTRARMAYSRPPGWSEVSRPRRDRRLFFGA